MARVLNQAGVYVSEAEAREFSRFIGWAFFLIGIMGVIEGYLLFASIPGHPHSLIVSVLLFGLILVLGKFFVHKLEGIHRKRLQMRMGAIGEAEVATILEQFPDEFYVIHGVNIGNGDLDHVVIGPTGVYALDTKNWSGVIEADGADELLLNGKSTNRPTVAILIDRLMRIREEIRTFYKTDAFFQAILVFPKAGVEARWGKTGAAFCMRPENLWSFIVDSKFPKKLNRKEIAAITEAFRKLMKLDQKFQSSAGK